MGQTSGIQGAIHLVPGSFTYAAAAQQAANLPTAPPSKPDTPRTQTTEVTVLCFRGHKDQQIETATRACQANAIAHKVCSVIKGVVNNPICIIAGHWCVNSKSRGNFVYTLAGEIPFTLFQSYECLLLAPFPGSSQLCPSLGWTRLLAHGVPITDDQVFGPDALLKEVWTLLGKTSSSPLRHGGSDQQRGSRACIPPSPSPSQTQMAPPQPNC